MTKLKNEPDKFLVAFVNGAVGVFNLAKRKVEFQTEAGHAETVFDINFCPFNRDILASCSYDATLRVWDASQMKLLSICDTLRNSPLSKLKKHIIYSLSWHPSQN